MASTIPNFLLTPQQQQLLFAALNANRPAQPVNSLTMSPSSLTEAALAATKPTDLTASALAESSFLDYDYSFDGADNGLDLSLEDGEQGNYVDGYADGDDAKTDSNPSNADNDSPDKRGLADDDDEQDGSAAKRREAGEKVPKKPGRKPLTSEPSSKRKAQNRAAQRAFRERKEKHLKDLETKVAELEKASEAANSENSALRAQVEKMTIQLTEYKKRMAVMSRSPASLPAAGSQLFGNPIFNNINDVSFQFEFPKFGQLPGPPPATATGNSPATASAGGSLHRASSLESSAGSSAKGSSAARSAAAAGGSSTPATSNATSPADSVASPANGTQLKKTSTKEDLSKLSSVFTMPLSNGALGGASNGRTSMDSASTCSPSSSAHSHTAPCSSCGTSPESYNQSPMGFKPVDTLTTIGEEQTSMFSSPSTMESTAQDMPQLAGVDVNDMNWLSGQSSFTFDPQLFGDYREPQENILANGGFDDSFFNDALDVDFTTPFNMPPSPIAEKTSLIAQIDAAKDGEFASSSVKTASAPVTVPETNVLLTCNKIWERLQNCPKVQNGDFDLDALCGDLQKKAKCSGSGAVVDEKDFENVINKYFDKGCARDALNGTIKVPTAAV